MIKIDSKFNITSTLGVKQIEIASMQAYSSSAFSTIARAFPYFQYFFFLIKISYEKNIQNSITPTL